MLENNFMIHKIKSILKQYKYIVSIILIGTVLLLWPSGNSASDEIHLEQNANAPIVSDLNSSMETRLESVLGSVEGVGRVRVFLSLKQASETEYAANSNSSTSKNSDNSVHSVWEESEQSNIVTVRDSSGNESAVVVSTLYPTYRGALIVCDGGDDPGVKLSVINAVSSLLGIRSDTICVMKMDK